MNDPRLTFTVLHQASPTLPSYFTTNIKDSDVYSCHWSIFAEGVRQTKEIYDRKEYAPLIIPASWKATKEGFHNEPSSNFHTKKSANNVLDWYMLPVDVDEVLTIEKAKKLFKKYSYVGYTTYNHTLKKNKFRLLFPLAQPISNHDFQMRKDAIRDFIDCADKASLNASQGFYLPSCHEGNKEEANNWINHGEFLDLNTFNVDTTKVDEPLPVKKWEVVSEIDLSTHHEALEYLMTFIQDELSMKGDHKDCLVLHSILNSFLVSDGEHENILRTFKRVDSKHNIHATIKTANPKFGGIGSMVNLFKRLGVLDSFDMKKFKTLSGIITRDTTSDYIGAGQTSCIKNYTLSNNVVTQTVTEDLLSFNETKIFKNVGDILTDGSFMRGINILDAPTNSGKTYLFTNILKRKRILIVPTKSLVEQISSTGNIDKCYEKMAFPKKSQAVVMTYDKIQLFMNLVDSGDINKQDYDLFVDEAHNLYSSYSYRPTAMNSVLRAITLLYFEKVILMSGTLREEFLPKIKISQRINITRDVPVKQVCNVIHTNGWVNFIQENTSKDHLTLILINDKMKGRSLSDELLKIGIRSQVFNANNQSDIDNIEMLSNEFVKDDINALIFTSIGVEGLNIKNINIKKIIAVGDHSSATLEQLKNRARSCNPELFLIKKIIQDKGYVRNINIRKKLKSADNYLNYANGELENANKYDKKSVAKQININLKSLPSDLEYIIGFDPIELNFFTSNLGLAAYLYDVDCSNEKYNEPLFTLHMNNYNFTLNKEIIKYDDPINVDAISKVLKQNEIDSKSSLYVDLMNKHVTSNKDIVTIANDLERNIDHDTDEKIIDFDDFVKVHDLMKKSSMLARFYTHTTAINIVTKCISDPSFFDIAYSYAQQIVNHAWIRGQFEDQFKVNETYSPREVLTKFGIIEAQNKPHGEVEFDKCRGVIKMSKYLARLFSIKKPRIDNGDGKVVHYKIISHNPLGLNAEVPSVINIFPPKLSAQDLSKAVDYNRWIRITVLRKLVDAHCSGQYPNDASFMGTLKDHFLMEERCLKSGIKYYKFMSLIKKAPEIITSTGNFRAKHQIISSEEIQQADLKTAT